MNKNLLLLLLLILTLPARAAEERPVPGGSAAGISTSTHALAVGVTNILDTYLSPENYTGAELRYIHETLRFKEDKAWGTQLTLDISASKQQARSRQADELAAMLKVQYARLRRIKTNTEGLSFHAGAQTLFNLGGLYNTRNGNNPAQARLGLSLGPIAGADYTFPIPAILQRKPSSKNTDGTTPKTKTATLHYQLSAPLLGLQFSPNYGQSYYEIFTKGDYDRNIVPTTIIATPSLRQILTLDIPLNTNPTQTKPRTKTLRIGYLQDLDQSRLNNLKYHSYTHALLIGLSL